MSQVARELHPVYDDPTHWGDAGIWVAPPFNVGRYQKELDEAVGTNADGKPIVRLKWSWDCKEFFYTKWGIFGQPLESAWRQKYRFMTVKLPDGDEVDISPPRWVLEQRFEPGQYAPTWDATRHVYDPVIGHNKDVRGECPSEWYNALPEDEVKGIGVIAYHNKFCCEAAEKGRRRCWGGYKVPGASELRILRRARGLRDAESYKQSPHEPLTLETLEDARRQASFEEQEIERETSTQASDLARQHKYTFGRKYSLPGFQTTESGLLIPT